jgi:hypothetical protein
MNEEELRRKLNAPIEVTPGAFKRLRDCTAKDLEGAEKITSRRSTRAQAEANRLEAGKPPKCDWMNPDGTFCEGDAVVVDDQQHLSFCAVHYDGAEGGEADAGVPGSFGRPDVEEPG